MELLNDRCSPPVLNLIELTSSTRYSSKNTLVDPEDRVPFQTGDLTYVELGHVYRHFLDSVGDVKIHMPYRVMCSELARVVSKYRSFRSTEPLIQLHKNPERARKNPKSCIQDFKLSVTDFTKFSREATTKGWILEKNIISLDDIRNSVNELTTKSNSILKEYSDIRTSEPESEAEINELRGRLSILQDLKRSTVGQRIILAKKIGKMAEEADRSFDLVSAQQHMERLNRALQALEEANFIGAFEALLRRSSNEEDTKNHLKSLGEELAYLAKYYPVLSQFKVKGDVLILSLSGVDIELQGTMISVKGDLSCLKPYTVGVSLKEATMRNRFSGVFVEKGEE